MIPGLESTKDQESPFLTADELTIYFSSSRPGSVGKKDIFVAHRPTRNDAFALPVRVPELSTVEEDFPTWLSDDGCRMIIENYASGNAELFYAERPK